MKPSPIVISILKWLSTIIPTWKIIPGQDIIDLAIKEPEIRNQVRQNQYCYKGKIRLRTGFELLRISTDIEKRLQEVSLPFLVLHGKEDKVTDKDVSQQLHEVASSIDKTIKIYPEMWHGLLYGEPQQNLDRVYADIISWLEERSTLGNSRLEREHKHENDRSLKD
nr:caffeoylshikimate esterase [Quercus suber]